MVFSFRLAEVLDAGRLKAIHDAFDASPDGLSYDDFRDVIVMHIPEVITGIQRSSHLEGSCSMTKAANSTLVSGLMSSLLLRAGLQVMPSDTPLGIAPFALSSPAVASTAAAAPITTTTVAAIVDGNINNNNTSQTSNSLLTRQAQRSPQIALPVIEGGSSDAGPDSKTNKKVSSDRCNVSDITTPQERAMGFLNRRRDRLQSRAQLAGVLPLEPLRELFYRVDTNWNGQVTWDEFLRFVVDEASASATAAREEFRPYMFSRQREGRVLDDFNGAAEVEDKSSYQAKLVKRLAGESTKKTKQALRMQDKRKALAHIWRGGLNKYGGKRTKSHTKGLHPEKDLTLIEYIDGMQAHRNVFAISTAARPLCLYSKSEFNHVRSFTFDELGGTAPTFVSYLPKTDTFLVYLSEQRCIRGYSSFASPNPVQLVPYMKDETVRQWLTLPKHFPYSIFMGDTLGNIVEMEVPRARSGTELRVVRTFERLHSRASGGVLAFTITPTHIFSTGFDRRLVSISLLTGHRVVIGNPPCTLLRLAYSNRLDSVLAITSRNELVMWDAKAQSSIPYTLFDAGSFLHHDAKVVGIECPVDLPQVITADCRGVVKIWDVRSNMCTQSIRADGIVDHGTDPDAAYLEPRRPDKGSTLCGDDNNGSRPTLRVVSFAYFPATHEIVTASADTLYCLQYNLREDPRVSDVDYVLSVSHDVRNGTFITQGPTRVCVWSATEGHRRMVVDRTMDTSLPPNKRDITALCVDDLSSRIFLAFASGTIELYSTAENMQKLDEWVAAEEGHITEMDFSVCHRLLIGVTSAGALILRSDDAYNNYSVNFRMTTVPLSSLTVSYEVGLAACCDAKNHVYLYDIKVTNAPSELRLDRPIVAMKFLADFPLLLTAHPEGEVIIWTTSPVAEAHIQVLAWNVFSRIPASMPTQFSFFDGRSVRGPTPTPMPVCRSANHSGSDPLGDVVRRRRTSSEQRRQGSTSSPSLSALHVEEMKRNTKEITCVTFNGTDHVLYFGDSLGYIHIFNICSLLQMLGIQRCRYENRSTFKLRTSTAFNNPSCLPHAMGAPVEVHQEGIISVRWLPLLNTLITSGYDHRVILSDAHGKQLTWLSMARIPQHKAEEELENSITVENMSDGLGSFTLPTPPTEGVARASTFSGSQTGVPLMACSHDTPWVVKGRDVGVRRSSLRSNSQHSRPFPSPQRSHTGTKALLCEVLATRQSIDFLSEKGGAASATDDHSTLDSDVAHRKRTGILKPEAATELMKKAYYQHGAGSPNMCALEETKTSLDRPQTVRAAMVSPESTLSRQRSSMAHTFSSTADHYYYDDLREESPEATNGTEKPFFVDRRIVLGLARELSISTSSPTFSPKGMAALHGNNNALRSGGHTASSARQRKKGGGASSAGTPRPGRLLSLQGTQLMVPGSFLNTFSHTPVSAAAESAAPMPTVYDVSLSSTIPRRPKPPMTARISPDLLTSSGKLESQRSTTPTRSQEQQQQQHTLPVHAGTQEALTGMLAEYNTELRRCVVGECAKYRRLRLYAGKQYRGGDIGDELRKVDAPFSS